MGTPAVSVIAENDQLQLLHQPGAHDCRGDYCLVIFAPMFSRADGRTFWGAAPAKKLGVEAFGIMPKSPNWYPKDQTNELIARITEMTSRPIMTYGASMGGYGALRFGAALGAQFAVAFSPQVSIEPAYIGKDDIRYNRFYDENFHKGHEVTPDHLAPVCAVFHDPYMHHDAAHIRRLGGAKNLLNIKLPYIGHPTINTAASTGVLGQVFDLASHSDATGLRGLLLPRRRLQVGYYREMGLHLSRKTHLDAALGVLDYGLSKFPDHPLLHHAYGRVYHENNMLTPACAAFRRAIAVDAKNVGHYDRLAKSLMQAGKHNEAVQMLDNAPLDHITFSRTRSKAYEALGDYQNAIKEIKNVLMKRPEHRGFLAELSRLQDTRDK